MNERKHDTTAENESRLAKKGKKLSSEKTKVFSPGYRLLNQTNSRFADPSITRSHASTLRRAKNADSSQAARFLRQLQRQYGNRYVQRVVDLSRKADDSSVAPEIEQSIQQARGGGQALDSKVRSQMESSFGTDFSNVRVHTDAGADSLNRALNSRAFTTGQDIFFRQSEYNPGSSSGRELLAHELTHVVQQTVGIQGKLNIGRADDKYEQEADQVAREVVRQEHQLKTLSGREGKGLILTKSIYKQNISSLQRDGPSIGPLTGERLESYHQHLRTFEIEILEIFALGPLLKINFRIRHPLNEWQNYHFFGLGAAAGINIPILDRPSNIETHTTRHEMRPNQFRGRGRVVILGIPHTNIRYMWLTFIEGPENEGYASFTWRLSEGIRQPYALGLYTGRFDFGHGLAA